MIQGILAGFVLGVGASSIWFWLWLNKGHREARAKAEEMEGVLRDKILHAVQLSAERIKHVMEVHNESVKGVNSLRENTAQKDQQEAMAKFDASQRLEERQPGEVPPV